MTYAVSAWVRRLRHGKSSQFAVMKEDVEMLKNDWLTDNVISYPSVHKLILRQQLNGRA